MDIPYGYCHCGCAQKTNLITHTSRRNGLIKGQPYKFIIGHSNKGKRNPPKFRDQNPHWKGGKVKGGENGNYNLVLVGYNGRSIYKCEHILIAERILGKTLPRAAIVHHVNGNPRDNRNCNLVICEDQKYHMLLHKREKLLQRFFQV